MASAPGRAEVLSFRVGDARLAIAARTVAEVVRRPRVTRVPHAPASLLGLAHLRGETVPVVSLARLLGVQAAPETPQARLLLIAAETPFAVAVDSVGAIASAGGSGARAGQVVVEDGEGGKLIDVLDLLRRDLAAPQRRATATAAAAAPAARAEIRAPHVALMSFDIAAQAYALPLEQVAEVLALPASLARLPGGDAAALGVIAHREGLLPLISLRSLLGLGGAPPAGSQVVVTRLGGATIGFVVDRLGSITRVSPDRISPTPGVLNRGAGEAQILSLCRLPGGRGLVSILSADRLFRSETVARILAEAGQEARSMAEQTLKTPTEQFVVFSLGAEAYGLPIAAVDEIVRLPDRLTPVPRAPAFIEGVINLRGRVVPVIDQGRRFQAPAAAGDVRRRLIVTTVDQRPVAFVVDRVTDILSVPSDRIAPTPDMATDGARLFDRVARLEVDGRLVLLIDPKALLDQAERDLLAQMQAKAAPGVEAG